IHYGSGNGTPAASDTSLFTFAGQKQATNVGVNADYTNFVVSRTARMQLGTTDAVGVTITEIGLASGTGSGTLTTHAMLQDMNGNPISIAKTDTDIINIYSTVYCHWNGNNTGIELRWNERLINAITGLGDASYGYNQPIRTLNIGFSRTNCSYVSESSITPTADVSNKRLTYAKRFDVGDGNIDGINSIMGTGNNWNGLVIQKGTASWSAFSLQGESVGIGDGTNKRFKTKFGFPYNATVYVNGIAVSSQNVTVEKKPSSTAGYLYIIDNESTDNNIIPRPYGITNTWSTSSTGTVTLYNSCYSDGLGIAAISVEGGNRSSWAFDGSDDLENWTALCSYDAFDAATVTVPTAGQLHKYYRIRFLNQYGRKFTFIGTQDGNNIEFNTAPANGDVITADYTTDLIPKDSDHVLDVSIILQFGEYQGQ
ncbi:MAG: hypothetical protein J5621_07505, partial [Paludibacteraceae bacterium]|nr:hypothetical protein [Paludibacteraceae bacterium]